MHARRQHIHANGSLGERAADRTARAIGSWRFLGIQSGILAAWIAVNSIALIHHFDPFPYILCNLALSFQAAFTGPVLLIAANRAAQRDRLRDDTEAREVEQSAALIGEIHGLTNRIHALTVGQNVTLAQQDELLALIKAHIAGNAPPSLDAIADH